MYNVFGLYSIVSINNNEVEPGNNFNNITIITRLAAAVGSGNGTVTYELE